MNHYLEMLRKSINKVEADFSFTALIDHNSSKGSVREQIIKNFLRPFLPKCYGISGGQAFDKDGNLSKQLDVVIYDDLYSYIAPYMEDFIYFPCESIFGNIEIKSKLDSSSFNDAVENIKSMKILQKEAINGYYVNPIKKLVINNVDWNIQVANDYMGIIFAYDSVKPETVIEYIKNHISNQQIEIEYLPNLIVLFKEQIIICRYKDDGDGKYSISHFNEYNGFMCLNYGEDILAAFLLSIMIMLRNIDLKAMKVEDLIEGVNGVCLSNIKEIIPSINFNIQNI
ncbi:MAG: hypothetical protein RIN55_05055 [Tissierellaceae bacterium]|nr:hypothetical protein [Tissierellaceae bacterium]